MSSLGQCVKILKHQRDKIFLMNSGRSNSQLQKLGHTLYVWLPNTVLWKYLTTAKSHEHYGISHHQQPDWFVIILFRLTTKITSILAFYEGGFASSGGFSPQRPINRESLSWSHDILFFPGTDLSLFIMSKCPEYDQITCDYHGITSTCKSSLCFQAVAAGDIDGFMNTHQHNSSITFIATPVHYRSYLELQ